MNYADALKFYYTADATAGPVIAFLKVNEIRRVAYNMVNIANIYNLIIL